MKRIVALTLVASLCLQSLSISKVYGSESESIPQIPVNTTSILNISDEKVLTTEEIQDVAKVYTLEMDQVFTLPMVHDTIGVEAAVWSSSNTDIATVIEGTITAKKQGECVISATVGTETVSYGIKVMKKFSEYTDKTYEMKRINDSVKGSGSYQFNFHGQWGTDSNINTLYEKDGSWTNISNESSATNARNNYYEIKFVGEKIKVFGNKEPGLGIADVYIDDVKVDQIDMYNQASKVYQQLYFESTVLDNTEHTLKVVMTGTKNSDATAYSGYVDYVDVIVERESVFPTAITFDKEQITVEKNVSLNVNLQFTPNHCNQRAVEWIIGDTSIVEENQEGTLVAKNPGTTTIKAKTRDSQGQDLLSNVLQVTVLEGNSSLTGGFGDLNLIYLQDQYDAVLEMKEKSKLVSAWRGDTTYSTIVLASKSQALKNVKLSATDFVSENGDRISSDNVKTDFLKYTKASKGWGQTSNEADYFMSPDIVYKDIMDIPANSVQPTWITMKIPSDAKPGFYSGKILATLEDKSTVEFVQNIEVIDLVQPSLESSNSVYMEMWNYPMSSARYYGVEFLSEEHFEILRPHLLEYKKNGGKTVMATIVEEPWNHQTYDDTPSMVQWTKNTAGEMEFDYTLFDKYVEFVIGLGLGNNISCYSIVPWENKVTYYDETLGRDVKVQLPVGTTQWTETWRTFLNDFKDHLDEKGWFDRIWITMDERTESEMIGSLNLIESIKNKDNKQFKVAGAFNHKVESVWDRMHHVSPIMSALSPDFKEVASKRRSEGKLTSIYTCTRNFPNMYNYSHSSEAAWTIWMTFAAGADGYMRWAYDAWVENPLEDASHNMFETGDVQMVYPGDKEDLKNGKIPETRTSPRNERLNEANRDVQKLKYIKETYPEFAVDVDALMNNVTNYIHSTRNEETRQLVDKEVNRLREGVFKISRTVVNGGISGNIIDGNQIEEDKDTITNLVDGKVGTSWSASKTNKVATVKLNKLVDISKIALAFTNKINPEDLLIEVLDETGTYIKVFDMVLDKTYTKANLYSVNYPGFASKIRITYKGNKESSNPCEINELFLFGNESQYLDKRVMNATASSEQTGNSTEGLANYVLDDNKNTFWHTNWNKIDPNYTLTIDLGESTNVKGFEVLPRQSGTNGIITKYNLEVSTDGVTYTSIINNGIWTQDQILKKIEVNRENIRYIKLVTLEGVGNFASVAEIYVEKSAQYQERNIERAKQGIGQVEKTLARKDYQLAQSYILQLDEGNERSKLLEQLNQLEHKVSLNELIVEAKKYDATKYTKESYSMLKEAVEVGESILKNDNASQEIIKEAKSAITKAINGLVLVEISKREGWLLENNRYRYYEEDKVVENKWVKNAATGKFMYAGKDGYRVFKWQKINKNWYYLGVDGIMQTDWKKIDGVWYLLAGSGKMLTGWQKVSGSWYYLNGSGKMLTGWQKISGSWYYLNGSGKMLTGWQKVSGTWYLLASSGKMLTGWQKQSNKWYYLKPSGAMATGWIKIGNKHYYLYTNGVMAANTWIGRYYVDGQGVWSKTK